MKGIRKLVIACALLALTTLAIAQKEPPEPGGEPASVRQTVAPDNVMNEKIERLLSRAGVRVAADAATLQPTLPSQYREVRIRWEAYRDAPPLVDAGTKEFAASRALTLVGERTRRGALPLQRSAELSAEQLVVVAVDAQDQARWSSLIPDPRVLRAESPASDAEARQGGVMLSGRTLHRTSPEFTVNSPADGLVVGLRFYIPRWTGAEFVLETLGSVALNEPGGEGGVK